MEGTCQIYYLWAWWSVQAFCRFQWRSVPIAFVHHHSQYTHNDTQIDMHIDMCARVCMRARVRATSCCFFVTSCQEIEPYNHVTSCNWTQSDRVTGTKAIDGTWKRQEPLPCTAWWSHPGLLECLHARLGWWEPWPGLTLPGTSASQCTRAAHKMPHIYKRCKTKAYNNMYESWHPLLVLGTSTIKHLWSN